MAKIRIKSKIRDTFSTVSVFSNNNKEVIMSACAFR